MSSLSYRLRYTLYLYHMTIRVASAVIFSEQSGVKSDNLTS